MINFDWTDSMVQQITRIEDISDKFHFMFTGHGFDKGMHEEFKGMLTPKDDSPLYSQSLSTGIILEGDILGELAFLHRYGILTTLPFATDASPVFAQGKPNDNLRLLVDLREMNNLYQMITEIIFILSVHSLMLLKIWQAKTPFPNRLLAGLSLQMVDQMIIGTLVFNFASRTFAYRKLAQERKRALSVFSSFMREYLDKSIEADQCAQNVDDKAAIDAE